MASFRNINDSKMSAAALIVLFEKAVFMIRSRSTNKIRNSNPTEKRGQAASVAVDVCLSPPATCGQQPPCRSSGKAEEDLRTYSRVSASFFWNSNSDSWLRRFLFRRLRREIDNNNNIKSNKGIKKSFTLKSCTCKTEQAPVLTASPAPSGHRKLLVPPG